MPTTPRVSGAGLSGVILALLLVGLLAPAAAATPVAPAASGTQQVSHPAITEVTAVHADVPSASRQTVYHWSSERTELSVTVSRPDQGQYVLCRAGAGEGSCISLGAGAGETTVQYYWDRSAATPTPTFVVREAGSGDVVAQRTVSVVYVARDGDLDGDGLSNRAEAQQGTYLGRTDSDGDGLADPRERELGTDPMAADSDGDGLDDGAEMAAGTDPLAADTDGDGISDARERQLGTNPTSGFSVAVVVGIVLVCFVFGFLVGLLIVSLIERIRSGREWTASGLARLARTALPTAPTVGPLTATASASAGARSSSGHAPATPRSGVDDVAPGPDRRSSPSAAFEAASQDLVKDEVVIEQMLEAADGQMRQSDIVEITDWSKAKVSRLLSQMADQHRIVKVRLGRENAIYLPGSDPSAEPDGHAPGAPPDSRGAE
ncbi:MAG: hypothetical protein ABEJ40_01735 [Haloarculaceae archaeon]